MARHDILRRVARLERERNDAAASAGTKVLAGVVTAEPGELPDEAAARLQKEGYVLSCLIAPAPMSLEEWSLKSRQYHAWALNRPLVLAKPADPSTAEKDEGILRRIWKGTFVESVECLQDD